MTKLLEYFAVKQEARPRQVVAAAETELHPELEKLILERHQDGQKPVPWAQVKAGLDL